MIAPNGDFVDVIDWDAQTIGNLKKNNKNVVNMRFLSEPHMSTMNAAWVPEIERGFDRVWSWR